MENKIKEEQIKHPPTPGRDRFPMSIIATNRTKGLVVVSQTV